MLKNEKINPSKATITENSSLFYRLLDDSQTKSEKSSDYISLERVP